MSRTVPRPTHLSLFLSTPGDSSNQTVTAPVPFGSLSTHAVSYDTRACALCQFLPLFSTERTGVGPQPWLVTFHYATRADSICISIPATEILSSRTSAELLCAFSHDQKQFCILWLLLRTHELVSSRMMHTIKVVVTRSFSSQSPTQRPFVFISVF